MERGLDGEHKGDNGGMSMKVPEKLYLIPARYSIWRDYEDEWSDTPDGEGSVEYIRKEVFTEKACKWLEENAGSYLLYPFCEYDKGALLEDFKKAMRL